MKKISLILIVLCLGVLAATTSGFAQQSQTGSAQYAIPNSLDDVLLTLITVSIGAIAVFMLILIPSLVCATAARRKGLSASSFFMLSFFFTPIIGFLAVIAMTARPEDIEDVDSFEMISENDEEAVENKEFKLG